jgi:hypothetical protein
VIAVTAAVIGYSRNGWRLAALSGLTFVWIAAMEQWNRAMEPLSVIEAGKMAGATRWQLRRSVWVSTARTKILVGVIQVIMQCLAMVVPASFIGMPGMGHQATPAYKERHALDHSPQGGGDPGRACGVGPGFGCPQPGHAMVAAVPARWGVDPAAGLVLPGDDHGLQGHRRGLCRDAGPKAFREKPDVQIFAKRSAPLNRCTRSAFC